MSRKLIFLYYILEILTGSILAFWQKIKKTFFLCYTFYKLLCLKTYKKPKKS